MSFMQVEELLWELDWPDVAVRTCSGIPHAWEYLILNSWTSSFKLDTPLALGI